MHFTSTCLSLFQWLCSVVAGLLHYLFLSVFCWSLAEGIMLYILIVKVYGSLADKWYLLLPLGWGKSQVYTKILEYFHDH